MKAWRRSTRLSSIRRMPSGRRSFLTTTAPGHDVLRCLNDASLGCGAVVAAQAQAVQMQAYSYESQYP